MKKILPIISACFLVIAAIISCDKPQENSLLVLLDETLEMKETYNGYFKQRIVVLEDVLREQVDPEQMYSIRMKMAQAYRTHSFDSTLNCLLANRELAVSLKDEQRIAETAFMLIAAYTMAGYHVEAGDLMSRYAP